MFETELLEVLREFSQSLTKNFDVAAFNPAQAEDQLKGPVGTLLHEVGEILDLDVVARTEAQTAGGVRPDIGVSVGKLLEGHVELKAPGKGARATSFSDKHDREQFKKLRDHPNLVYTDGNEWGLYRRGELVGPLVRAAGDVRTDGAAAYDDQTATALEVLFRDFLGWEPLVPRSPRALAELLAPLTRLLRETVALALDDPESALTHLAVDWRGYFFPDADNAQFADAYAQTLTYALLLARIEGAAELEAGAPETLDRRHPLLAQILRILTDTAARKEVETPLGLLDRVIRAVDPEALAKHSTGDDLWLYFYEDFLAAYDPRQRKQRGVYFTPPAVVQAQVTLVDELLRTRFGKNLGFADDEVVVLDPAVGTGTYLLAAMARGLERVREVYGGGNVAGRATIVARNFHGFELLVGAYAVAHLRFSQRIAEASGELPEDGAHIYLTDTLESPHVAPPELAHAPLFHAKLAQENERARRLKTDVRVLACIGNPPYFRQVIERGEEEDVARLGGWVRRREAGQPGILEDFIRDAPGVHVKNLYNLYVYFWRWALWKVFENSPGRGIVSFITPSSYLRGPGFAGMRKFMRQTFDDLWILDLGGEGRGARLSENVFDIQTPVAIAVGVRYGAPAAETPARVRYARIDGTRAAKYAELNAIGGFGDLTWEDCFDGWTQSLLPTSAAGYFSWPALTDVWPWQHSGAQWKRTWPLSQAAETLVRRWRAFVSAPASERNALFRETRDRTLLRCQKALTSDEDLPVLSSLEPSATHPPIARYAYRSLDRQYCLADNRLGDFIRPVLWGVAGARQLFMSSLLSEELGPGPAATVTRHIPDLHHFSGRGGKDVIPLWRDAQATKSNLPSGLLDRLRKLLNVDVDAEALFAYCYALLSAPSYTTRFAAELEIPGPRVPLTRDGTRFDRGVELGRRLIWLHTFGERFIPEGETEGRVPQGAARATQPVPGTAAGYPRSHSYDPEKRELHVGEGVFAPVAPEARAYSVSGLDVIGSWLDYRMKDGAGRRSSPLDAIRPETWPAQFTEELLQLLWMIEHTVALGPELDALLDEIVGGDLILAEELPQPTPEERQPPK
ncbi:MAG: type ISP restriction/modification enzyme [Gaiellaceae bacterium]